MGPGVQRTRCDVPGPVTWVINEMNYFLTWLFLAATALAAAPDFIPPKKVFNTDDVLVISDGSSVYEFHRDGAFHSYPVGFSGRCFDGTWTAEGNDSTTFTVTAKFGWMNGWNFSNDYRKVVFVVYPGHIEPADELPFKRHPHIFKCYFMIDELTKIAKPENAQQAVPGCPPQGAGSPDP